MITHTFLHSFIHFEPVGHSRDHGFNPEIDEHYDSMLGIRGGFNHNGGLPPYILDGSLEAFQWRRENPEAEWEPRWAYEADEEEGTGSNGAHYSAHTGNVELLKHIIENPQHRTELIHEHDNNGWLPIHEVRVHAWKETCVIAAVSVPNFLLSLLYRLHVGDMMRWSLSWYRMAWELMNAPILERDNLC